MVISESFLVLTSFTVSRLVARSNQKYCDKNYHIDLPAVWIDDMISGMVLLG
jgi:hypothetical protein